MNGGKEMDVSGKQSSEKRLIDYYYLAEKIECPGARLVYWDDIEAAPTVDAVPVVRCKDCVNGTVFVNKQGGAEYVDCVLDDYSVRKPTDYCSYGERKEG